MDSKSPYEGKTKRELQKAQRTLEKAKELISDPERWTRGSMTKVNNLGGEAEYSYCALGAINAARGDRGEWKMPRGVEVQALASCSPILPSQDLRVDLIDDAQCAVIRANDDTSSWRGRLKQGGKGHHRRVLGMFDCAISKLDDEIASRSRK